MKKTNDFHFSAFYVNCKLWWQTVIECEYLWKPTKKGICFHLRNWWKPFSSWNCARQSLMALTMQRTASSPTHAFTFNNSPPNACSPFTIYYSQSKLYLFKIILPPYTLMPPVYSTYYIGLRIQFDKKENEKTFIPF